MNFISPELRIKELKQIASDKKVLHFQFEGKFTKETSIAGSQAWTQAMRENENRLFEFVWNCSNMTGFELSARKEWYDAMQGFKQRIAKVYVISDRIMIRSAAKVMLQFFGIASEIFRSEADLPKNMQQ